MGLIETKKVMMVGAKKLVIFILSAFTSCTTMYVSSTISGRFYEAGLPASINSSLYYQFNDSTFETLSSGDLEGIYHKGGGAYRIAGDTLILDYEPLEDPDPSTYEFIEKGPFPEAASNDSTFFAKSGNTKFRVANKKNTPLPGVTLLLLDNNKEIINGFISDSLSNFPNLIISTENQREFNFSYLGRKPVRIPVNILVGYNSILKITLSDSATYYSNYDGIKKYLIKKAEQDEFVFQPLDNEGQKRIVLKRDDSE